MGQKSAADKLPEALRVKLSAMLRGPAVTRAETADAVNAEAGEALLPRSSMNRCARRMKHFAEKNRQAKETADAYYIDKYGTDNRVKPGRAVNGQIRLAVFDLIGGIEEIREDPEIKSPRIADMLRKLSRGLKELEAAEKLNAGRTGSIRKTAPAEAAGAVEKEAEPAGLDDAAPDIIRRKIPGI